MVGCSVAGFLHDRQACFLPCLESAFEKARACVTERLERLLRKASPAARTAIDDDFIIVGDFQCGPVGGDLVMRDIDRAGYVTIAKFR